MPLVSVVMAVFNAEHYLREALDSILAQKGVKTEVIVIDDGSSDASPSILAEYEGRIISHRQSNSGQASALNEALGYATGDYIAYLDADDVCLPGRFSTQVRFFDEHPEIDLVYSPSEYIDQCGRSLEVKPVKSPDPLKLLYLNDIPHSSVMHRRKVLDRVGTFDASYLNHDWDLWVRISEICRLGLISTPLIQYRVHKDNLSRTRRRPLNHYRWARMTMLKKAWERRGYPWWLRLCYERARFEWWILSHPGWSERGASLWWYSHSGWNIVEKRVVQVFSAGSAYPSCWIDKSR